MEPRPTVEELMRPVSLERGFARHAEGSCMIRVGHTHVLVTASVENRVPGRLRGSRSGWVSAEYAMLPRSTHERSRRDTAGGRPNARSLEIQRLIGRSLRSVCDLESLGERQIILDCDVIQADGGTRTAAITGAWIALHDCIEGLRASGAISQRVLRDHVAAVSAGFHLGLARLDMDYEMDRQADVDFNVVMSGSGEFVEIQGTAEGAPYSQHQLDTLLKLCSEGITHLIGLQKLAVA